MNWTSDPVERPEKSKTVPQKNKIGDWLEAIFLEKFQHLLQGYVNGSVNPVARVLVGRVLSQSKAARRYVVTMRQVKEAVGDQPLYQPNPVVLQKVRTRIGKRPLPARNPSFDWIIRTIQVVLGILTLVIFWRTRG